MKLSAGWGGGRKKEKQHGTSGWVGLPFPYV